MSYIEKFLRNAKTALFSVLVLVFSVFADSAQAIAATTGSNTSNVQITSINSSASHAKQGDQLEITVSLQGNANVKAGDSLTFNLPQATDTTSGLYGVTHDYQIDGKMNGKTVPDVATAHVQGDKVTIEFNKNVEGQFPNGFTGTFSFGVRAQAAKSQSSTTTSTTVSTDWGTDVKGPSIVIDNNNSGSQGGSGVSSTSTSKTPVKPDVTTPSIDKYGQQGKDGNINWQITGVTPANTGMVTITDTPNQSMDVEWGSFRLYIIDTNGQQKGYTINQIQQLGGTVQTDTPQKGGFVLTMPANLLNGKKWRINYRQTVPTNTPTGTTYVNHVSASFSNQEIKDDAQVKVEYGGGGQIIGFDNGKLTFLKEDGQTQSLLPGATFTLTSDNGKTFTAVSDSKGQVSFTDIVDGNYTLKETKAPEGYQLSNKEYHFTVSQGKITNSDLPKDNVVTNTKLASSSSSSSSKKSSSVKS